VRITARLTYGLRALVVIAGAAGEPVKGGAIAGRLDLSLGFLEVVLGELRRAGLVGSKRGGRGGYWLARPADAITVADVIRVLDGESLDAARVTDDGLSPVWQAIVAGYMDAAQQITLAQLSAGAEALDPNRSVCADSGMRRRPATSPWCCSR
jgi:Rrf2 family protein